MRLGTTYICVEDINKSLNFYRLIFEEEPAHSNDNRWITFHNGNSLSLYNKKYDEKLIREKDQNRFNQAYIEDFTAETGEKKNNVMILNFEVEDLKAEYERIKGRPATCIASAAPDPSSRRGRNRGSGIRAGCS